MTVKVSVVVPHYNDLAGLALCLQCLASQSYPRRDFEIIVGDNQSPVERAALESLINRHNAQLVIVTERGAGPARNGAAALATGNILAFTDSDCQPQPDWLANGIAALAHAGVIGGRMTVLVASPGNQSGAEAFEMLFAFDNKDYVENKGFTVSANLFTRRIDFERVGGFCTGKSEDNDWCQRATAHGLKLEYAPLAVVGHPARRNWAELIHKWKRIARENFQLMSEQKFGRLKWLLRTWAMPLSAIAHTPRVLASHDLTSPEKYRALVTLYRLRLWRFAEGNRLLLQSLKLIE